MVALSVYKGNLHKVPDIPRKWVMPPHKLSLKDFKILYKRRARALARLSATSSTAIATTSTPETTELENEPPAKEVEKKLDSVECVEKQEEEKTEGVGVNPSLEIDKKEGVVSDKEKRRQEIEERLQVLTEKKHSLVKILKQILNAEEVLKRLGILQGTAIHPPVALQVDTTHDSSSIPRLNTPKTGSDRNASGLVHTSSPSPISQSQQRKSAFNVVVKQASRTISGMANSPSGFALTGQQGNPSGTTHIASSPSPSPSPAAARGGTSASKDGRFSSSWN